MPFAGRDTSLATPKPTCLTNEFHVPCKTPYLFMWLIPEGTIWQCPKCSRKYVLDKNLRDTGGDRYTDWINLDHN